ncbi:MAG: DUF1501 domain-containing protein, partial [Burkholderiaceae bacterium]|nr:DUF1501 domain-containing protein [Burkholderiaceae bacterium]
QSLFGLGATLGTIAFNALLQAEPSADNPLAPKPQHIPAKAKRCIFLMMEGGPSHIDTFDPKPALDKHDGKKLPFDVPRTRKRTDEPVFASPWEFRQHGQCGQPVSALFPHIATRADDLCFLHGMHTEGVAHGPSTIFLHTGATNLVRPSMGAWISYGLGTENENLPAFVTIHPAPTKGGPRNYGTAFLPSIHQGTPLGRPGQSAKEAKFKNLKHPLLADEEQREQFAFLQSLNRHQGRRFHDGSAMEGTIESFELAYRLQSEAPEASEIEREPEHIKAMYGIGEKATDEFGRQCLLARRLSERGVRYIQVNYSDTGATPRWDQHSNLKKHADHALATDKPVAGLLADLKQRGLLEDTLVWWGGEFGRTPFSQNNDGRDHNPYGFTVFLAGGGVKPGFRYGATDEFGHRAAEGKVHMHDLHATILHLLGLDHEQLTFRHAGRDFRLTDVHGRVVREIMA